MRNGLMVLLTVLLVSTMALSGASASVPPAGAAGNCPLLNCPLLENNRKLMEVSQRLVLADLAALGIPLAGFYVDAGTATVHVGLTAIKDEYTEPIKAIVNAVEGVNLVFFQARFTEAELRSLQGKIDAAFFETEPFKTLKKNEAGIPFLTMTGVDIGHNRVVVGLRELKPQYIEAIRKVVGAEAPIKFVEASIILEDSADRTVAGTAPATDNRPWYLAAGGVGVLVVLGVGAFAVLRKR